VVRSMTGFGRSEIQREGVLLITEIRSVNHRYCEISTRLPRSLGHFESNVRTLVQRRILRGKLSIAVTWNGDGGVSALGLDEAVADRYFKLLQALKDRYKLSGEIDLKTLVSFPDLLTPERLPVDDEASWKLVEEGISKALDDVISMKDNEGGSLRQELEGRAKVLLQHLDVVEKRASSRGKEARDKMRTRLKELLEGGEVPEERLALEVVIFADKIDCTEECVRLHAHVKQFLELLDAPELVGRKLNFLLQEMNREANTMGAKALDVEIVNQVISLKDEIEKLREQVQNVE
jgi:uncharacterized protein (TIGR00255 family)